MGVRKDFLVVVYINGGHRNWGARRNEPLLVLYWGLIRNPRVPCRDAVR
jgi:hypothetical protein